MYFRPMSFVWEVAQWSTLTRSSSNAGMIISRIKECENPTDWERLSVLAGTPDHFSYKFHIFPGANSTQIRKRNREVDGCPRPRTGSTPRHHVGNDERNFSGRQAAAPHASDTSRKHKRRRGIPRSFDLVHAPFTWFREGVNDKK